MKRFNTIKKSRKRSKDIDEKIEYLNKECQKTGLQEVMTTSNVYVGTEEIPNTTYVDFESITAGGYKLGLSGADGNAAGGAINGDFLYATGVALSPPHPVTGERYTHYHVTDGTGGGTLLRPGQGMRRGFGNNRPLYTMGSALWFFNPNANNGSGNPPGRWFSFEYYNNNWGFWDTIKPPSTLAGFSIFNTNLSEYPGSGGLGAEIAGKISGINFNINGEIGAPTNTIFIKNDLGDPNFLPINIDGISSQAFDYLRNKAGTNVASSLSGGGYGGYHDVGGGDFRGIDQILRMYNDPDKHKKYPDRMLKNIDRLMIDLDLVQNDSRFSEPVSDIEIPGLGAKPGDQLAFGGFGGGGGKTFDTTKKQNRRDTYGLINAVNSGDPLFLPPGVTMDQAREWVKNYSNGNLKEESNLKKYLEEGVKLGHFDPEVLNVNIDDLRKGIMPEFPKDPPPEMIGGYSAKSRLVRKEPELPPFINVTKKDLAKNHKLTDKEISDFMNDVKMINDYIKRNPAELRYAMIRYPKDDPRLAQLNFKMDQMKAAGDEYMDTHFPENQKLFNKLQDKIIRNIKQTDPKNFKGHKEAPKFTDKKTEVVEQRKKTILKHFKKSVKIKKPFKY